MTVLNCEECKKPFEVEVPKFCCRDCFHTNYGKNHRGTRSPRWKGDNVNYHGIHTWLKKTYGKGGNCDKCQTENPKLHWALVKGKKYERKRENFLHLCPSCHKYYDMTDETRKRMSDSRKRHLHSL